MKNKTPLGINEEGDGRLLSDPYIVKIVKEPTQLKKRITTLEKK